MCISFFFYFDYVHTFLFVNVNLINLMNICDLSQIIEKRKLFINDNYDKLASFSTNTRVVPPETKTHLETVCIRCNALYMPSSPTVLFSYFYLFLNDLLFQSILTYARPDERPSQCLVDAFIIHAGPLHSHNLSQL